MTQLEKLKLEQDVEVWRKLVKKHKLFFGSVKNRTFKQTKEEIIEDFFKDIFKGK